MGSTGLRGTDRSTEARDNGGTEYSWERQRLEPACACSFVRSFVPFFHPFFFPTASLFVSHFVALAGMELITQTKLTLNLCPCLPRTGIVRACQPYPA